MSEKSLRNKVIRLAHSKPELRKHLLPLIAKKAEISSVYYAVYSEKNKVLYYFGKANDARSALLTANKLANLLNDLKSILENPAPPLEDPLVYIPKIYGKRFTRSLIKMGLDREYPLKDIVSIRLDDKTVREQEKLKSFETSFLSNKQWVLFKDWLNDQNNKNLLKKAQWNSRGQWVDETGKVVETYYMEGKYFGNGGEYFEDFKTKEDMIDTYKQISRYRGYKRQVSPNPKSIKMFVEYEDGEVKEIRKR